MKFNNLQFNGDECCGGVHADAEFKNGYSAHVIKTGELFTVMCRKNGLLVTSIPKVAMKRDCTPLDVEVMLAAIEALKAV